MAKKDKAERQKKEVKMWIAVTLALLLFIAGILYLDYSKKKASGIPELPQQTPQMTTSLYPVLLDSEIQSAIDSGNPVILYFYSSTCGTCIEARNNVHALEGKLAAYNIKIVKISYPDNQTLFDKYGVTGFSTFIAWKGKEVFRDTITKESNIDQLLATILQKLGIG